MRAYIYRKTGVGKNTNSKRSKGRTEVGIHITQKGIINKNQMGIQ